MDFALTLASIATDVVVPILSVMGGAGVLAAFLPRPTGPKGRAIFAVLDVLASNYANARNAQETPRQ